MLFVEGAQLLDICLMEGINVIHLYFSYKRSHGLSCTTYQDIWYVVLIAQDYLQYFKPEQAKKGYLERSFVFNKFIYLFIHIVMVAAQIIKKKNKKKE